MKRWRKHEKEKIPSYDCGESSKNSVVCGAAGLEFSLELCGGSSGAALYAAAKRLKVSWVLFWSVCLHFWECWGGSERDAPGVQQEPRKLIRHCPKRARWRRLAVHRECWVSSTSTMWSARVGLRFFDQFQWNLMKLSESFQKLSKFLENLI